MTGANATTDSSGAARLRTDRESQTGRHRSRHLVLAAFAGVSVFLATVQISLLTLGAMSVRTGRVMCWVVFLVAAALAAVFSQQVAREDWKAEKGVPSHTSRPDIAGRSLRFAITIAIAVALVIFVGEWLLAALRAPIAYDSLCYHVPAIHGWVRAGRICWVPATNDLVNASPTGVETFSFFVYHLLGTDLLVDASNLWYMPLGALGLYLIASALGATGVWRWLAGALFFAIPVNIIKGPTCYVDVGFACAVIGVIAVTCVLLHKPGPVRLGGMILWGCNAGLMLGGKGTGAPFLVIATVALFWVGILRRKKQDLKQWTLLMCAALVVALAVGGYWYVRNWLVTGDPVYPVGVSVGRWVIFPGEAASDFVVHWGAYVGGHAPDHKLLTAWPESVAFVATWLQLRGPTDCVFGGIGYFWLAGALPGVCWVWLSTRRRLNPASRRSLLLVTVMVLAMFAAQPARWWARLTVWVYALGLPCFVLGFQDLIRHRGSAGRRVTGAILGLGLTALVLIEGATVLSNERRAYLVFRNVTNSSTWGVRPSLRIYFNHLTGTMFDEVVRDKSLARNALTGYSALLAGFLCTPIGQRDIEILPETITARDLQRLRHKGTRWVLWEGEPPECLKKGAARIQRLHVGSGNYVYVADLRGVDGGHSGHISESKPGHNP